MRICLAQIKPTRGDIQQNIHSHKNLIAQAVACNAEMIIFPELSLTGYEPSMAKDLAIHTEDKMLDDFQQISDNRKVTIGVGMPVKTEDGVLIGMILFQPAKERVLYAKQHLHPDEDPFFIKGNKQVFINGEAHKIALAICYELSVPEHSANVHHAGAGIYIASAAKTATGVAKAHESLAEIAKKYSMMVLFSNSVGECEDGMCMGGTGAWRNDGTIVGQLDHTSEGILIVDMETQEIIIETIS